MSEARPSICQVIHSQAIAGARRMVAGTNLLEGEQLGAAVAGVEVGKVRDLHHSRDHGRVKVRETQDVALPLREVVDAERVEGNVEQGHVPHGCEGESRHPVHREARCRLSPELALEEGGEGQLVCSNTNSGQGFEE